MRPLTVERLKKQIAKQEAKPVAQHHVPGYRQTEAAGALLYEQRRKQEKAVSWRKTLIKTIEAEGPMTEERAWLKHGKRRYPITLYRVNGTPRLIRRRGDVEVRSVTGYDEIIPEKKAEATKIVAEAEKWVAAKKAEGWTKADFAVAFKKFINGGE